MSEFVLAILTSEGCGHCSQFRGNGVLGNEKALNSYSFLESHIDPLKKNSKITIINIHFGSMSGNHSQIQVVSKFTRTGNYVQQERYYAENGNTFVNVLVIDNKEKPRVLKKKQSVLIDNKEISWTEFIQKKIPKNIERYTFFYPCFVLFRKDDWKKGGNILGLTNAGFVIRDPSGTYGLEKNGQSLQQRNLLPQKLIIGVLKGEINFQPNKDFYVEPKVEEVEEIKVEEVEEKKVEEEKKKVEEAKKGDQLFLIRGYHDE